MSLTDNQLAGKPISTSLVSVSDTTWEALARDKKRRRIKKFIKKLLGVFWSFR